MNAVRLTSPLRRLVLVFWTYRMQCACDEFASCAGDGSMSPLACAAMAAVYVGSQLIVGSAVTSSMPCVAACAAAMLAGGPVRPTGSDVKPPPLSVADQKYTSTSPPRRYVSSMSWV